MHRTGRVSPSADCVHRTTCGHNVPVSWLHAVMLFAAGILGGLTGSIAGLASVATYPALLVAGLPPVTANVTNTVALVFNGVGSVLGSRPELAGQRTLLTRALPFAVFGGVTGAALLLSTPAEGFEKIVPVLLGFASLAILLPVRPARDAFTASRRRRTLTPVHPTSRPPMRSSARSPASSTASATTSAAWLKGASRRFRT